MSWLWIYAGMMEWVGIILVVYALGKEQQQFSLKKTFVYFVVYSIYYILFCYFQFPAVYSFISYLILFGYIIWCYGVSFVRNFAMLVIVLMVSSVVELLSVQIVNLLFSLSLERGGLQIASTTLFVGICLLLSKTRIYKIFNLFDKWEPSYALVAVLSLMTFTPVVAMKIIKNLDVSEYVYISICIIVMWLLISKIQKTKLENSIRKKYLDSFTEIITQIRRRQHKVKNQFNTAFSLYQLYDNYDELVEKQKEYLGRLWDYELPTDAIILEDPIIVALLYEKINEAIESGIEVETVFSCSMVNRDITDVIWVQILGTLLDNAIEALRDYEGSKRLWIEITEKSDGGEIFVCIANTCRKIKQSEMEKFFELGYSTKGEGRGVGLYDVKQLVYKNKGYLVVDNVKRDNFECFEIKIIL